MLYLSNKNKIMRFYPTKVTILIYTLIRTINKVGTSIAS